MIFVLHRSYLKVERNSFDMFLQLASFFVVEEKPYFIFFFFAS